MGPPHFAGHHDMALSGEGLATVGLAAALVRDSAYRRPQPFIQTVLLAARPLDTLCMTIAGPGSRHRKGG